MMYICYNNCEVSDRYIHQYKMLKARNTTGNMILDILSILLTLLSPKTFPNMMLFRTFFVPKKQFQHLNKADSLGLPFFAYICLLLPFSLVDSLPLCASSPALKQKSCFFLFTVCLYFLLINQKNVLKAKNKHSFICHLNSCR